MTEEKALRLFARCYNACDFTVFARRLHKNAGFEAYNRFYRNEGRESVARLLREKAAELRALPAPNRAYYGFVTVRRDLGGTKVENCVVLTKNDPWQAEGIVRIKCSLLHIKDVRILNPAECQYTRADYAGMEVR